MAKNKDKIDAAIVTGKMEEDNGMALTTQNQDEISEGDQNPKEVITDGSPIDAISEDAEKTMDEKINEVGIDVPTVERPKAKPKPKTKNIEGPVFRECTDRAAILFLAKTLLTPSDLDDFKTLYPSLF